MERLTDHSMDNYNEPGCQNCSDYCWKCCKENDAVQDCNQRLIYIRLADYEDTGLLPGDIRDLQGLCKENGLSEYVDLIVQAKRQMDISNDHSIAQDERIEQLESENASLRSHLEQVNKDLAQYQIPMLVIQENWNPSKCPRCDQSFRNYEPCDDGYYKRAMSLERCPYCGQNLTWDLNAGLEGRGMKHNWIKNENGTVDEWAWDCDYHNGPICNECGCSPCVHCSPDYDGEECSGEPRVKPTKTEADHIRSMSDEELAEFVDNIASRAINGFYCNMLGKRGNEKEGCWDPKLKNDCEKCALDWLQRPHKGE